MKKEVIYILITAILGIAYIGGEVIKVSYKEYIRREDLNQKNIQRQACAKCLEDAENNYYSEWENNCSAKGLKNGCSLPLDLAKDIEKNREHNRKICIDKSKNNVFREEDILSNSNLSDDFDKELEKVRKNLEDKN